MRRGGFGGVLGRKFGLRVPPALLGEEWMFDPARRNDRFEAYEVNQRKVGTVQSSRLPELETVGLPISSFCRLKVLRTGRQIHTV